MHPNGYGFLRSAANSYNRERSDPFVPGTMIERYGLRQGIMIKGTVQPARRQQGPRLREITDVDDSPIYSVAGFPVMLGWAQTIHKAQGSEFAQTFVVLPSPCRLLSRELLYTGITRTKGPVTVVAVGDSLTAGQGDGLETGFPGRLAALVEADLVK